MIGCLTNAQYEVIKDKLIDEFIEEDIVVDHHFIENIVMLWAHNQLVSDQSNYFKSCLKAIHPVVREYIANPRCFDLHFEKMRTRLGWEVMDG